MKQLIVGTYELGSDFVQIVLREGTGGEFYLMPEHGKVPRVKIGADYKYWWEVANVLLHEIIELSYEKLGCRTEPSFNMGNDHSKYIFVIPHQIFSESTARVAYCLTDCMPDVEKAWKKWRKKWS